MKYFAFAAAVALASPAYSAALDELLTARCGTLLAMQHNPELLREDVFESYTALLSAWRMMSDAFKVDPPFDEVCAEKPILTVEEAMREAIERVRD